MVAAFKIRSYTPQELSAMISCLTHNGYKVVIEKGNRVSLKMTVVKDGVEYITEDGEKWEE